ncbi:MAG: SPOR domain-containing protein [Tepidisphaeraceae bacterium]
MTMSVMNSQGQSPRTRYRWVRLGGLLLTGAMLCGCVNQQPTELDKARTAFNARDYSGTMSAADAYIAKDPDSPMAAEAYYMKGRAIEAMPSKSPDEAREHLQQARFAYINALKTGPLDRRLEGLIRASIANVAYWQEDYATAAEQGTTAYGMLDNNDVRAWSLYRAGLSQQRMGQFEAADRTLQMVVQYYPNSEPASRAQARIGTRAFNVQILFSQPQTASAAAVNLAKMGLPINRIPTSDGRSNVLIGPYGSYAAASNAKARIANDYPTAQIVP